MHKGAWQAARNDPRENFRRDKAISASANIKGCTRLVKGKQQRISAANDSLPGAHRIARCQPVLIHGDGDIGLPDATEFRLTQPPGIVSVPFDFRSVRPGLRRMLVDVIKHILWRYVAPATVRRRCGHPNDLPTELEAGRDVCLQTAISGTHPGADRNRCRSG